MNETDWTSRIQELQDLRHRLLHRREKQDFNMVSIDMELSVVRSELQAIYALRRSQTKGITAANFGHYSLCHAGSGTKSHLPG